MSDRTQGKAALMREKMLVHYGNEIHHKHNKNHLIDPPHLHFHDFKTTTLNTLEEIPRWSHEILHDFKERKTRKRLDKGQVH